ncbi:ACHB-like protein [Mya arenaria]|uniref:ACHB-like protein n=1 Tax=Mya arenaria TaxID=6604 RepID=A0ABY7DZI9_MYAAR|nr:ACHB-like protein [Mya arenaria]
MGAPWINVYLVYLLLLCPLVVCYTTTHAGNLATALKAASNTDVRPSGSTEDIVVQEFTMIGFLLMISTWMYGVDELMLYTDGSQINFDLYEENGEWAVLSSSSSNTTRTLLGHAMSAVQFDITLQRKYQFYLLNIIFPITMLAVLGPFVFLLPVDSGEKNGFTLTVMLSMSVTMAYISDHIPSSALNVCVLRIMTLVFMVEFVKTSMKEYQSIQKPF